MRLSNQVLQILFDEQKIWRMNMVDVISALVTPLVKLFVDEGVEAFKNSTQLKQSQILFRDRLYREAKFNMELSTYKGIEDKEFIDAIETKILDDIFNQILPVNYIFPDNLDIEMIENFPSQWAKISYKRRITALSTQSELMNRIWHRVKMEKLNTKLNFVHGDLNFIRCLMRTLEIHLRKR